MSPYSVGYPEITMPEEDSRKMVPFFSSSNHDSEMEATAIHSVLEANGIPSILIGPASLPSLEFQVQVSEERLADAVQAVAEARAAGPAAAAEAELESEKIG
jgi:hypothetical protein